MKRFTAIISSHWILLVFLVAVSLLVRLHALNTPLADWHSWRQADTASVTREFIKHNYSILLPHYHDLSDIPNGLNNIQGYRMVEFPLVNYGIAQLIRQFPKLDLVVTSRIVSIVFSLISVTGLYGLVYSLSRKKSLAFLCAVAFGLMPYTVFYSRTILPEPELVTMQVLSIWFFLLWVRAIRDARVKKSSTISQKNFGKRVVWGSAAVSTFALGLLFKPMAIFWSPVFAVIALYELGWRAVITPELWTMFLTFVPLLAWRKWIAQFPSGIPASDWLFNGNGIRLRPAWWRWLFEDRFGRLMTGYWGLIFLFLGGVVREGKKKFSLFDIVTITWWLSMMAYLVVFATGNVQHDYYQYILTPMVAVVFGRGVWAVSKLAGEFASPWVVYPVAAFVLILTAGFSWYEVGGYYNINNPAIVHAGQAVDKLTPADAKVIAPYSGDTAFLFQTNRTGWPIGGRIDEKIQMGAQYYVTTAEDDEAKTLEKKYPVIAKTPEYVIIQLHQ